MLMLIMLTMMTIMMMMMMTMMMTMMTMMMMMMTTAAPPKMRKGRDGSRTPNPAMNGATKPPILITGNNITTGKRGNIKQIIQGRHVKAEDKKVEI